jgi:hypothetical protein
MGVRKCVYICCVYVFGPTEPLDILSAVYCAVKWDELFIVQ